MILSIIIPYHNEGQEHINPLLQSINGQLGVAFNNIEIIIVNDCEEQQELNFNSYTNLCNINYIKSQYLNNPGLSRQTGLDKAQGAFVMFCDSDDTLASYFVLKDSFDFISKNNADIYCLNFLEEFLQDNRFEYITKGTNITWVFSKIYKKEFLQSNNIRFSKEFLYHEDTYFNGLCVGCKAKMLLIPITGYVWKYNEKSITRKNNHKYTYNSCEEHIRAVELVQDKYDIRNLKSEDTQRILIQFFGLMYHNIHTIFKNSEYRNNIETALSRLINKHDPKLLCLSEKWRPVVNMGIQQNFTPYFAPSELFENFIYRIVAISKDGE